MQVAAQHPEAVSQRARISVKERLLLNGVALHAAHVTPRYVELSASIEPDLANAELGVRDAAAVPAGEAAHKSAVELLVELALADVFLEDVPQCGGLCRGRHTRGFTRLFSHYTPLAGRSADLAFQRFAAFPMEEPQTSTKTDALPGDARAWASQNNLSHPSHPSHLPGLDVIGLILRVLMLVQRRRGLYGLWVI